MLGIDVVGNCRIEQYGEAHEKDDDEDYSGFPEYPMYAQSYVPIQVMNKVFKPEIGLKKGTIFPELVSPYCPNQSIEEIEFIKMTNKIGEGCNK